MKADQTPNWRPLALALHNDQATKEFVDRTTDQLSKGNLALFGAQVLRRLRPSVYFGTATFPPAARPIHALHNSYIIAWIFSVDNVLDGCPSYDYAQDLQKLLRRRLEQPINESLIWEDLSLTSDPRKRLPKLAYSLWTVVENIQPLRLKLREAAVDDDGPTMFDDYLLDQIAPAMLQETRWRLGLTPQPNYEQYIDTAYVSICGGLCVSTVNAVLPNARWNWQAVNFATQQMRYATRLINDQATYTKEKEEGKPNAVGLFESEFGGEQAARAQVRTLINSYASDVHRLCWPYVQSADRDDPLYVLYHYIYYCWVITEAMYSNGDFTTQLRTK